MEMLGFEASLDHAR